MPGNEREMSGLLRLFLLTANDLEENILKGYDLGAEDYIMRPFNIKILLKKVDVALRHSEKAE